MDEAGWLDAITPNPAEHNLTAYGRWMTPKRAAALFGRWEHDKAAGQPSLALCRRWAVLLRFTDYLHQQLHAWCQSPTWPQPAPLARPARARP